MKNALVITLLFICLTTFSQSADDFRIVDGQLYNIRRSIKWEDLACGNDFDDSYAVLVVKRILKDGILDCDQEYYTRERNSGIAISSITQVLLKDYPKDGYVGMRIYKCRAMRLKNKVGDTANTYDYGLPNTPENRKKLIEKKE